MQIKSAVHTPLRTKLVRATVTTLILVGIAIAGVMSWLNVRTADENLGLLERQIGESIVKNGTLLVENHALALKNLVEDNALTSIRDLIERTVREDADVVYGHFHSNTAIRWNFTYPPADDRIFAQLGPGALQIDEGASQREVLSLNGSVHRFTMPIVSEGKALGYIQYGVSSERMQASLKVARERASRALRNTLFLIGAAIVGFIVMGGLLAARAARRITEPLSMLTGAANEIASGRTKVRAAIESGDEIEVLSTAFNRMLEVQEETFARLEKTTELALEASRLKDEFLANMSHEIRTPMNGILGMVQLILGLPIDASVRRYTEIVDSSAQALLSIINDILDFSKLEAGKYELQKVNYDPRVVVQEVVELYAPRAHGKNIEVLCYTRPPFPALVEGDPDRFRQVLSNLVANAVKFTETGEVFVDLSIERAEGDTAFMRAKVVDTGIGISKEGQARLFEAFSQVDGSMVRKHGGTGLGLAISKRIAEVMGGRVGVESELGRGSTFWFTAKVRLVDDKQLAADPIGRRALVVDKNARWREVLSEHISSWGMACRTVSTGEEAIEAIARAVESGLPPDIMIVSAGLGDMPVDTLVEAVRKRDGGQTLPVVLLTHLGTRSAVEHRESFAAQLRKPMRMSELYDQMVGIFTGKQISAPKIDVAPRPSLGKGSRILVVDDNEINQIVATEMLQGFGYVTDVASDGRIAIEKAQSAEYAAILMDCQMPVMDGYTATRRIREIEAGTGKHVPIIALTAHAMVGERDRVLRAGMDDYLSKPARPSSLLKLLTRLVGDHRDSSADVLESTKTKLAEDEVDPAVRRSPRLLRLFLKLVPGQVESLRQAIDRAESVEVRAAAHKLKGSALSVAAGPLANIAEMLQVEAEKGDLSKVSERMRGIDERYARVEVLLRRELDLVSEKEASPSAESSASKAQPTMNAGQSR